MSEDIKNVRFVEVIYNHTITFDIQEIANDNDFETDEIEAIEAVKWGHLHITLKDGSVITPDVYRNDGDDLKWAKEQHLYDANGKKLAYNCSWF